MRNRQHYDVTDVLVGALLMHSARICRGAQVDLSVSTLLFAAYSGSVGMGRSPFALQIRISLKRDSFFPDLDHQT